jgi:energy-coupling factor transporter transmembrane protein EcfT
MSKHTLFLFSLIAFIIGVFLNNCFINPNISFSFLLFIGIFLFNLCLFSRKTYFYVIPFFIIFFLLGIFISHKNLLQIENKSKEIQKYFYTENNDISIEIEKIDSYTDYSKDYLVKLLKINGKDLKNEIA